MKDYPFSLKLEKIFDPIINLNSIYTYPAGRHVLEKVYDHKTTKISSDNLKKLETDNWKVKLIELYVIPHETKWTDINSTHCGYPSLDPHILRHYSPNISMEGTAKLFFIYGGDLNSKMEWFKLKPLASESSFNSDGHPLTKRNYAFCAALFKESDCELIFESKLQNLMFINVSLPHRINNSNSYKKIYIISCLFEDEEYEIKNNVHEKWIHYTRGISIKQASQIYNNLLEK
jgi:hypothetical protein